MSRRVLVTGAMAIALAAASTASAEGLETRSTINASQAVIGRQVGDHWFTATDGRALRLSDLRGRPVVVSLIYTSCHEVCPGATTELQRAVRAARQVLRHNDFTVLSIGFDTGHDTPPRMLSFARSLGLQAEPGWRFLSTDAATIAELARELGFTYRPTPRGFDHVLQTTVLDREGRVFGQIYGMQIAPPALVEPLKRIYLGAAPATAPGVTWLERARLLCTVFDPKAGRYRFDYSLIISMITGALSFAAIAGFIVHSLRGRQRVAPRDTDHGDPLSGLTRGP
ncbi:MAG: SCO family protein [Gammaproteobacteria bacterium]|nr:SCO family protein [Gammaproteobacteria bacterium]